MNIGIEVGYRKNQNQEGGKSRIGIDRDIRYPNGVWLI